MKVEAANISILQFNAQKAKTKTYEQSVSLILPDTMKFFFYLVRLTMRYTIEQQKGIP